MESCLFCKIVNGEIPSTKVYEDADTLAFLDIKPVNPGHTLVIPKKHFTNIHETPDELLGKMAIVAKKISDAILKSGAKGINIGMNNGAIAGQSVFHAHIHVMPRYGKDSFSLWVGKEYDGNEREEVAKKIRSVLN
ncbi:MAG: HIT family protein [bacterium]|nr:HIT family protein [bacterium]